MTFPVKRAIAFMAYVFLLVGFAAPSQAATVVFYSAPEGDYGWCAGYSYSQCETFADQDCQNAGGTACQVAVECSGGAGALAFSQDKIGAVGIVCHASDQNAARAVALELCMAAGHALCKTDTAFTAHGQATSNQKNAEFDLNWTAQVLLGLQGYLTAAPDGVAGSGTKAAVKSFEAALGLVATGKIDDRLLLLLMAASGGPDPLLSVASSVVTADASIGQYGFNRADSTVPARSLTSWLLTRSTDDQRLALGVAVHRNGSSCTIPAVGAAVTDEGGQQWHVACAEGDYAVTFDGDKTLVADAKDQIPPRPVSSSEPPSELQGQPADDQGTRVAAVKAATCQFRFAQLLASAAEPATRKSETRNLNSPPPTALPGGPDIGAPAPAPTVTVECDRIPVGENEAGVCRMVKAPDQCVAADKQLYVVLHVEMDSAE